MTQLVYEKLNPFPHLIVQNMYNDAELDLIWEELNFLTKPNKLLSPEIYGAVQNDDGSYSTTAKALTLDYEYHRRELSNILTVNRKLFTGGYLETFSKIAPHCRNANHADFDLTKVRYYQNGDHYDAHWDITFEYIAFSYFYKEPKCFDGGELFFPEYDYEFECKNNSMIIIPSYVYHGVKKIIMSESKNFTGNGRYCITQFTKKNYSSTDRYQ